MSGPDYLALAVCVALAIRVTLLQRRLRESDDVNVALHASNRRLSDQLAESDLLEWTERRLISAAKREFVAHQRYLRSGPRGDMHDWKVAKAEMDQSVASLLIACGEMPTPAQMRAVFRASLPPSERPPIHPEDETPVYGMVAR